MPRKKIGLVLGGGGAKGFAHIGVLKFIEEKNIPIDYVAGTSIGAIIGALHCLGYTADEMEELVKRTNLNFLFDIGAPKKGLIKGDRIESYLRGLFEGKKFSDLKKPLFIVACDINDSNKVIFNKGDLAKAVRASISIPGVFRPVINRGRVLVDGGVLDNLPIDILKNEGVKNIIAVNLEAEKIRKDVYETADAGKSAAEPPHILETLLKTYTLITSVPLEKTLRHSEDSVIISPKLKEIKIRNFNKAEQAMKIGYAAAKERYSDIKSLRRIRIFKKPKYSYEDLG